MQLTLMGWITAWSEPLLSHVKVENGQPRPSDSKAEATFCKLVHYMLDADFQNIFTVYGQIKRLLDVESQIQSTMHVQIKCPGPA